MAMRTGTTGTTGTTGQTNVLSASTLIGNKVYNLEGEKLGDIKDVMLDVDLGRIAYAVLSFGGFLGMGDKLFAIPFEAFRVDHGSWKEAFGYRFVTPDRVIVISGDCRPTEALVEAATGADLLVHEVYSLEKWKTRPPVWQRYHATFHTSTKELAAIAERAKPKRLVLTHQLFWGATPEELVAEIRAHYGGPVVSGSDLDIY